MIPKHFSSWSDYWKFVIAKGFYFSDTFEKFPQSTLEKISQQIFGMFQKPLDKVLRNIRSPVFIAGLNIVAVVLITLMIYPDECFLLLQTLFSPLFHLEPWMLKFALYILFQVTLLSLWTRTMSRLNNSKLMQAWMERKILPIHLGSVEK